MHRGQAQHAGNGVQIIYASSMAEEAFLDALRQGTSCEGAATDYEVCPTPST